MWLVWCPWAPPWKFSWYSEVSLIQTFYLLWRSDMMFWKGLGLPWAKYIDKHLQYLQPVVTLWIFFLFSYSIILRKLFLEFAFADFDFSFIFTLNACFLCALYGNVTSLFSLLVKKTMQNTSWTSQVCTKFVNVIMENNWLPKSGATCTLYHVVITGFQFFQRIFLWGSPGFFCCDKIPMYGLDIFICLHQQARYKIRNIWFHVTSRTWV